MSFQKNYKSLFNLFFLFPLALITGPFFPDFFVCLVSILFLIVIIKNRDFFIFKNFFFYYFFFFYIYLNLNSSLAYNALVSFETSIPYFRFILFAFILSYLLISIKNLRRVFLFSFIFIYFILFLDSCVQLILGYNIFGFPLESSGRVSSFFNKWLVMGSFVARTLPVLLAINYYENLKFKNIINIFILLVGGCLIFFSGERLAFFYYLTTLFAYTLLILNKKNFFIIFLIILFSISSFFYFKPSSYNRLINHTYSQLKSTSNFLYASYRHELHYVTAYNIFKDRPLFGFGLKSFRFLCDKSKYAPTDKIINDNLMVSPVDGYISFDFYNNLFFIKDVVDNKSYRFLLSNENGLHKLYIKNGEFVKKGHVLGYSYEYLNGCNTHPHNVHMQFLSELGLFGYSFLAFAFCFILWRLFLILKKKFLKRRINKRDYSIFFCLLGLFLSLFPLFTSGNFFNNWLSAIFYFNVANFLSFQIKKN